MDNKKQIHNILSGVSDNIISDLIFTFIKENNIAYTENKNGIFFNISLLNDELANKLLDFINQISNKNIHNIIDDIIPEKKQKQRKKTVNKPLYKNYDINDLELIILGFSFQ